MDMFCFQDMLAYEKGTLSSPSILPAPKFLGCGDAESEGTVS